MRKAKQVINPLAVLAANQKVGQSDTDAIALPVLIHLDIAHRGLGDDNCCNFLTKHLLIALYASSKGGNRQFYDLVGKAWDCLAKAARRKDNMLRFTTGEYRAIRHAISAYLRVMPSLTVGVLNWACAKAQKTMDGIVNEAANGST